ncbi:hypothetical protein Y032_0237g3256 [Ancylostoma ceylanicum]|uniref:Uncharacterized protein n=1 Tax=Ancylostoma ceylanicum TaxID=53326 RepID=A0A016SEG7_9BILA|nr:hypothetical protein Y032_0237g3256 [Ancylostoma ceylanicum]
MVSFFRLVASSRFCVDSYLGAGWIFAVRRGMPVGENAIMGILICPCSELFAHGGPTVHPWRGVGWSPRACVNPSRE